jgi:hypothetical protein
MLTLVKDLENFNIVFYWIDSTKKQVSPLLPTLTHAREWYTEHCFSLYKGNERRQRICDRRNSEQLRWDIAGRRNNSQHGRRASDKPIHVDVDLAKAKINEMQDVI